MPSPTTRPHRELNLDHDEAERLSASEGSPEGRTIVNPGHVHGSTTHLQLFSSASAAGTATGSGNQGESGHLVPSVRARAVCVTVHLYAMKQIAVGTGRAAGPGAGGNSGPEH